MSDDRNLSEILAIKQFHAVGLNELNGFGEIERNPMLEQLVLVYNNLSDRYETEPSLRVNIGR